MITNESVLTALTVALREHPTTAVDALPEVNRVDPLAVAALHLVPAEAPHVHLRLNLLRPLDSSRQLRSRIVLRVPIPLTQRVKVGAHFFGLAQIFKSQSSSGRSRGAGRMCGLSRTRSV